MHGRRRDERATASEQASERARRQQVSGRHVVTEVAPARRRFRKPAASPSLPSAATLTPAKSVQGEWRKLERERRSAPHQSNPLAHHDAVPGAWLGQQQTVGRRVNARRVQSRHLLCRWSGRGVRRGAGKSSSARGTSFRRGGRARRRPAQQERKSTAQATLPRLGHSTLDPCASSAAQNGQRQRGRPRSHRADGAEQLAKAEHVRSVLR